MDKMKMSTPDFTRINVEKIAEMFPNVVTEAKDEQGNLVHKIDFEKLKQELSSDVIEGDESYDFTWVGIFGFNAIMSVILNENMDDETKLTVLQMLIDNGCDVNWINCQGKTALMLALERIEPDIANLLLDNGAILYKN